MTDRKISKQEMIKQLRVKAPSIKAMHIANRIGDLFAPGFWTDDMTKDVAHIIDEEVRPILNTLILELDRLRDERDKVNDRTT